MRATQIGPIAPILAAFPHSAPRTLFPSSHFLSEMSRLNPLRGGAIQARAASSSAGAGRRKEPFYAVAVGRAPGIYRTWDECREAAGAGFTRYKKFETAAEAEDFIRLNGRGRGPAPGPAIPAAHPPASFAAESPLAAPAHAAEARPRKSRSKAAAAGAPASPLVVSDDSEPEPAGKRRRTAAAELGPHGPGELVCFTDGACSANGRAGARAAYAAVRPARDTAR